MTAIAIVGMGCLLPGAHSPEEFWAGVRAGSDLRTEGGREVFGTDPGTPGGWGDDAHRITATRGGFVTEPEIDLTGFGLPADELAGLDRVVRWPLWVADRALSDAGLSVDSLRRTGIVLGNYSFPTESSVRLCVPLVRRAVTEGLVRAGMPVPPTEPNPTATAWTSRDVSYATGDAHMRGSGGAPGVLGGSGGGLGGSGEAVDLRNLWPSGLPATVVARALCLGGPRLALDAACSSALYAFALARDYLLTGAADVMLAGAVCAPDPLLIHLSFSDLRTFPQNGVSQPFDAASNGIVTGQGAGIFVLKRLDDALADGDRIHAVVESIGLSNDGAGKHVLSPNFAGQIDAYTRAYAAIDPSTVDYIECHATGTPVGDATELRSLAEFFGSAVPLLGSVKGNVGHLLTVAGFTSVLKAIMAMRHGVIPATPGIDDPITPDGAESAVTRIVRKDRPWPDHPDRPRRAAVSAFGFGGTNAHLVLTPAPAGRMAHSGPPCGASGSGVRSGSAGRVAHLGPACGAFGSGVRSGSAGRVAHLGPACGAFGSGVRSDSARVRSDSTSVERDAATRQGDSGAARPGSASLPRLAITGLGVRVGPLHGVAELAAAVRTTMPVLRPRPERRWYGIEADGLADRDGGYLDDIDVDVRTYRLPPNALRDSNPQHLVLFEAAEQALIDAGYPAPPQGTRAESLPPRRVAVVIAMEAEPRAHTHRARFDIGVHVRAECARAGVELDHAELDALEQAVRTAVHDDIGANEVISYIGNVMASRVASSRNLTGPAFTLSADTTAGARALEVAGLLLLDESIEAVLVGGVDLAAGVENTLVRERLAASTGQSPPVLADGAAAVVVTRADAVPDGRRVYATIESIALGDSATARASAAPSGVDYLELCGDATVPESIVDGGEPNSCVVGGLSGITGDTQHASVLVALVKVASCLYRCELPASPSGIDLAGTGGRFTAIGEPQPWLAARRDRPRVAAISAADRLAGLSAQLVLHGAGSVAAESTVDWPPGVLLLPITADDGESLAAQAAQYAVALREGADPLALCRRAVHGGQTGRFAASSEQSGHFAADGEQSDRYAAEGGPGPYTSEGGRSGRYTAVLVASDAASLTRELDVAARSLPAVVAEGGEWATPGGSYCTARPAGPGKVAFVYPGAFTSYPGAGRELFRLFPGLLAEFERHADRPRERFKHGSLYPRGAAPIDRRTLMRHEAELVEDIPVMLAIGTNLAVLHTQLLRDVLGIAPHGGFGYSLGESSMLFAMGVWADAARDDAALAATPLFRDRLRGPKTLIRELWRLGAEVADSAVWATYVLLAGPDAVRAAMAGLDRVFLTHVNTPGEVVVAGDPAQCRTLVERAGCQSARAPANHVMHVPLVRREHAGLAELNSYPLGSPAPGLELLSAFDYDVLGSPNREVIAERIADTLCDTIDFARLASTAHDRGFRYFVEVGPGATCTRWITETLTGRPHVAVSIDRRGMPTGVALAQALARLISNGLPVDLSVLFPPPPAAAPRRLTISVPVGADPIPGRVERFGRACGAFEEGVRSESAGDPAAVPAVPAVPAVSDVSAGSVADQAGGSQGPEGELPVVAPPASPKVEPSEVNGVTQPESPPEVIVAELVDDAITIEGEPFVYLPAAVPPVPSTPPARVPVPRNGAHSGQPIRRIASRVVDAHRAVLAVHDAVQLAALRVLELGVEPAQLRALDGRTETHHTRVPDAPHDLPERSAQPARMRHTTCPDAPHDLPERSARPAQMRHTTYPDAPHDLPERSAWPAQMRHTTYPDAPHDLPERSAWPLEFARGRIGNVFGAEYAVIDEYRVRVRLPEPPYLFVSRVTELDATPGKFEPSSITTEYDIPHGAWYSVDGLTPCAVTIEAGQCDLLLISYLGIDFRNKGERVYRLLDSTLTFHKGLPRAGQTLRYEIKIDRFVWNGDTLLFFFNYRCFADGELILELLDACAGFFKEQELDASLGVVMSEADRRRRAELTRKWFKPLARTEKTSLDAKDLQRLSEGRRAEVFGGDYEQGQGVNPSIRLPGVMLRMIDEITRIDRLGGPTTLGELEAVKHLDPDGWYFKCHFTGDPVLAGSLVAEGGVQLLQVYATYLGMHLVFPDAEFQSVPGLRTQVKVRGQITPRTTHIRYHAEITGLTMLPRPTVIADITVYDGDKPIISMTGFGIQVREKPGTPYRPENNGVPPYLGRRNRNGDAAFINELHLAHAAKGDLATAMGPEFAIYENRRAPYIPNGDFQFVDRIMRLEGTRGRLVPGARMVTEYDSSPQAWYYQDNSTPAMPNCVHMETSLQAAILLGYYLGATLASPDEELAIRNLDGTATVTKLPDLRGKTVRHESEMLSSQAVPGATLQRFRYLLKADGEPFYEGESLFGYFSEQALANQVGLDNGRLVKPWRDEHRDAPARTLKVREDEGWFDPDRTLRLAGGHLRMVDEVDIVERGGRHGLGYLRGLRTIDPADWYFDCHFHRDPVMPGSLGVEAIIQALQVYVIDAGLAEGMRRPVFTLPQGVAMSWRYRGQILRPDAEMTFEAHLKEIRRQGDRLLVIAEASVWKPGLRIYHLDGVAVQVREGQPQ